MEDETEQPEEQKAEKKDCPNCKKEGRTGYQSAYFRKTTNDWRCGKCSHVFEVGFDKIEEAKITMPEEQAAEEWKKYTSLLKTRKEKYLEIMKKAHYEMKKGRELLDVYKVMKIAGLNDSGEPKLAIARADIKKVIFRKRDKGTGTFEMEEGWNRGGVRTDIELPQETFNIHWERVTPNNSWSIKKERIKTKVPIIPPELMPEGDLKNHYVLWEPLEWEELPETKDPILLKRISQNIFVILGSWDLTPLEQSILRGQEEEE